MPYILSKGITLWFSWGLYLWLSPPLEQKVIQEKINNFVTSLENNLWFNRRVLKWLLFFIFLFAPQGIKRRKRERMVFDKNTQVCKVTCLYNHVDYNLLLRA